MRFPLTIILVLAATSANAQWMGFSPAPPRFPRAIYPVQDTVSLVFLGDVMMHKEQIDNAFVKESGSYVFNQYLAGIKDDIEKADAAVANLEFTLAGKPYSGYPCFSAPDEYASYAAECGIDIFLTANNHILDKGKNGIERTLRIYRGMEEDSAVRYTGTALDSCDDAIRNPLVIAVKGVRIALVNFTYGTNVSIIEEYPKVHRSDTSEIAASIHKAKKAGVDFIIALPHWGTEYVHTHSRSQRTLAEWLVKNGCDAVIGSHPHVVQDIEAFSVTEEENERTPKVVTVAYSMGNVISNMSATDTRIGMMVTLKIAIDTSGGFTMLPLETALTWCARPGAITDSYSTIPVKEHIGKEQLWKRQSDYGNMLASYQRVKKMTGIDD